MSKDWFGEWVLRVFWIPGRHKGCLSMHPMVMLPYVKMPCLLTVSKVLTTRAESMEHWEPGAILYSLPQGAIILISFRGQ